MKKYLTRIFLILIILFSFFLRTFNVNWDSGTHIHPDERFLTMVTSDMRIPSTLTDYLNPQVSTMNPHNINYGFFVYGTFPLYLVKILAILLKMDNYGEITLLGRVVSAFFDTGIVLILFFLSKTLFHCHIVSLLNKDKRRWKQKNANIRPNNETIEQLNNGESLWLPLLPPFLYSIMVLPIQLSHFFAVDTFLAFFMILSFCISVLIQCNIVSKNWIKVFLQSIFLGITIGLGLASKVTMIFIVPLDFLIIVSPLLHCFIASLLNKDKRRWKQKNADIKINNGTMEQWNNGFYFINLTICGLLITIVSYLSFRFAQPMAFSDRNFLNFVLNPKWIKNITDLQAMSSSSLSNTFPPAIQWFTTQPILFPLKNMVLWGMGIPLAGLCIVSLFYFLYSNTSCFIKYIFFAVNSKFKIQSSKLQLKIQNTNILHFSTMEQFNNGTIIFFLSVFILAFFVYQGSQFAKAMRYFYPIYWCFALMGGLFVAEIIQAFFKRQRETHNPPSHKASEGHSSAFQQKIPLIILISLITLLVLLIYPISFLQIYTRPHSRVAASRWIFQNIPAGSKVTFEEWDDPLPFSVDGKPINISGIPLPMFWPDSEEKWRIINEKLSQTDYLILSSNRVYGSVSRRPDIYPQTIKFYEDLFSNKLNFRKIAEFNSFPTFPFLNYEFIDDNADESFTVYDHPVVKIFKKI